MDEIKQVLANGNSLSEKAPTPTWTGERSSLDQPKMGPSQQTTQEGPVKLTPRLKKVPTLRKETFGEKLKKAFITGSDRSIKDYLVYDMIIPGIKNALFGAIDGMINAGRDGLSMAMFGDRHRTSYMSRYGGSSYVHYDQPSYVGGGYGYSGGYRNSPGYPYAQTYSGAPGAAPIGSRPTQAIGRVASSRIEINRIPFETRADAEVILDGMAECLAQYGVVTVANVAELVGIECTAVDFNYGWNDLGVGRVCQDRGAWIIDMPRPMAL